ncbi:MAG: response regulator [Planctomycetes bacterium]|nr:response regulator [Planctomycetota bacterium]
MAEAPHILLVEDEPLIALTLGDDLVDVGFRVTVVGDGAAALALVERAGFAAVVTDLRLPSASGLAIVQALRRRSRLVPVLVITAHAGAEAAALAEAQVTVVEKPFANGVVVAWLRGKCA